MSAVLRVRAATVMTPTGPVSPAEVVIESGRIAAVRPVTGPVDDTVVVPGFVDLQVNGVSDVDCSTADGDDWRRAGEALAATGVTAWLPTLVSAPLDRYAGALDRIASAARGTGATAPIILGAHLEGPFLGGRPGAHRPAHVVPIDLRWLDALPPTVRLVTLAPEQPLSIEATRALAARGVLVSLGHSAADLDRCIAAVDAGARMVTHLFNGMTPLHHREPGLVGAALCDDRLGVGLIADGVHVHRALYPPIFRAKPGGVVLVTDAVAWRSGRLDDRGVVVTGGAPRLPDGTIAGSVLTMDAAVRNVVDAGVPLADAVAAASATPAALVGEHDRGRIEDGGRADLAVLGAGDLSVRRTIVAGAVAWEA